ncbi:MAG: amidohydrolase family protein, partial [Deltaproteobacteria bacterium]|nr:amidohydrolase family protein [Deltaproteobacteria bacterium]
GHSTIRTAVIGPHNRKPTEEELTKMKDHVRIAMEAGALGLSTGLIYPPGAYADEDEIVALCRVVAKYGGSYCSHMRSEGDGLLDSTREAISIGKRAGIPVNISHIKVAGRKNWGKSEKLMELIDAANASGMRVTADMYPYKAGATALASAIPPKHAADGQAALVEKLKRPEFRAQVKEELFNQTEDFENLALYCGFDGMQIIHSPDDAIRGKTVAQIAEARGKDAFETFCDLIIETNGSAFCAYHMRRDTDIDAVFKHPMIMGGTDGGVDSPTFPVMHPRHFGTFPKLIKELVREKQLVTLEEAIRKFCSLPAETGKLATKGLLKEGYDADLLIFDYDQMDHSADYFNPRGKNTGFKYVFVNGEIAVSDDVFTGVLNGRVLRSGQ